MKTIPMTPVLPHTRGLSTKHANPPGLRTPEVRGWAWQGKCHWLTGSCRSSGLGGEGTGRELEPDPLAPCDSPLLAGLLNASSLVPKHVSTEQDPEGVHWAPQCQHGGQHRLLAQASVGRLPAAQPSYRWHRGGTRCFPTPCRGSRPFHGQEGINPCRLRGPVVAPSPRASCYRDRRPDSHEAVAVAQGPQPVGDGGTGEAATLCICKPTPLIRL